MVAPVLGWTAEDINREVANYTARVEAEVLSQAQPDDVSAGRFPASAPEARADSSSRYRSVEARPLPVLDGLGPARVRLRGGGVLAELTARFGPPARAKVLAGGDRRRRRRGGR